MLKLGFRTPCKQTCSKHGSNQHIRAYLNEHEQTKHVHAYRFGDSAKPGGGRWIYRVARGICLDPVQDRELAKSRGSGKDFQLSKTVCVAVTSRYTCR